ncbi:DMT family transporter [Brevibacterium sp. ZH18]|uniref:DMT family transporter n=1 Tax=Brevibacterium sp. ZH18 TaxID=2927784 RepID=UPI001F62233E|nr:DMT family transporter [Brevibacterium sp. ZH18]MCI4011008.1 DMT family transporter [Brevibacterium sp. ZH18]
MSTPDPTEPVPPEPRPERVPQPETARRSARARRPEPSAALAIAAVLAGALCLSVSAILVKLAGVDAATTAVLRCAIAVIALVPLALAERARHGGLSRSGILWAIAAGVALGVDYIAWTASIYLVGAGVATVLVNVQVIVLPLLALIIDRERVRWRFIIAVPLMLVGVGLVGGVLSGAEVGDRAVFGTVLALIAGTGYGIYLFLTRRATRRKAEGTIQPLIWASASAAVTASIIAMFTGGLHFTGISPRSWMLLIALALLGQVVAWLFINRGSTGLMPSVTSSLLLIQPVFALVLSALILAEKLTVAQVIGAVIVLVAVSVANGVWHVWSSRLGGGGTVSAPTGPGSGPR